MIRQEIYRQKTAFHVEYLLFAFMVFPTSYNGLSQDKVSYLEDLRLGISQNQMVQVLGTGSSPPTLFYCS